MTHPTVEQMQAMLDGSPFIKSMAMRIERADIEAQEVVIYAPMQPQFERGFGSRQWHGGPIAAAVDTVGDFALVLMVGRGFPTVNFRVDYFRPAIDTGLRLIGKVRRAGRSIGVADVDVFDDRGVLLAVGRCTYSTLGDAPLRDPAERSGTKP
jgi:uncharacterized protein (TIGR00369 family)